MPPPARGGRARSAVKRAPIRFFRSCSVLPLGPPCSILPWISIIEDLCVDLAPTGGRSILSSDASEALSNANEAGRHICKPSFNLATRSSLPQNNLASLVEADDMERVLAEIDAMMAI